MSTTRFVLLIAGAAAVAGAPLGYRTGLLPVNAALGLLVVGLLPSLWVVVAGVLMLVRGGGAAQLDLRTVAALVLAAGVSAVPLAALVGGLGAPPIHDITSDTEDPPHFDVIVAERAGAPNPLDYRGAELAATQRAAYPDIQPLVVGRPLREVVELARAAAEALDWRIVAVDPDAGLIEATDTTYWFGFKDDVAIRLRPDDAGATRVDVRSISRVGVGDLGANAARIRKFLESLKAAAG